MAEDEDGLLRCREEPASGRGGASSPSEGSSLRDRRGDFDLLR